jgi:enamine deaminase RidA (YjgF/YER057c/UK114 family)
MEARGRMVFVSGQVGWNPETQKFEAEGLGEQVAQALRNVAAVLKAGGALPQHVVRMTWYITDRAQYLAQRRAIGEAYRSVFGKHFPAMSVVVVAGLLEAGAAVEIEATAVVPDPGDT